MITGDASVNAGAPIICCTQEIVANLALRHGADAPIDNLVVDEFHYYSDRDRGWAWQVPLLELTETQFLLMSATLGPSNFLQMTYRIEPYGQLLLYREPFDLFHFLGSTEKRHFLSQYRSRWL